MASPEELGAMVREAREPALGRRPHTRGGEPGSEMPNV